MPDQIKPKLSVRKYDPTCHYSILASWWGKIAPSPDMLPDLGGIVVEADGVPAAAAFVLVSRYGGSLGVMDWLCASPEIRGETRTDAINLVLDAAKYFGRLVGCSVLTTFTQSDGAKNRLLGNGWVSGGGEYESFFTVLSAGAVPSGAEIDAADSTIAVGQA